MSWNAIGYSLLVVELILLVSLPRAWVKIITVMLGVAATTGLIMVVLLAERFFASLPPAAG
jgi:hypothetical protein